MVGVLIAGRRFFSLRLLKERGSRKMMFLKNPRMMMRSMSPGACSVGRILGRMRKGGSALPVVTISSTSAAKCSPFDIGDVTAAWTTLTKKGKKQSSQ